MSNHYQASSLLSNRQLRRQFSGERLQQLRKEAGLSRERLASLVPCSTPSIWRYEKDLHQPGMDIAFALAEVFEVPIESLFADAQGAQA